MNKKTSSRLNRNCSRLLSITVIATIVSITAFSRPAGETPGFGLPAEKGANRSDTINVRIKPLSRGVELSWNSIEGVQGYIVYRSESRFGKYEPLISSPVRSASFTDRSRRYAYYKVTARIAGKESDISEPVSLETEMFGPNTVVFSPEDSGEEVSALIGTVTRELADGRKSQFTGSRRAFLFKPGNYDWLRFEVGFYMQVAGLGKLPTDTRLDQVTVNTDWLGRRNATCNFWRILENLTLDNVKDTIIYGVSQAAPLRRMMIRGNIQFDMGGWASGGYLANSVVGGTAGSASQQQFFLRNNELRFNGVNWNLVSVGDTGEIHTKRTPVIIAQTPVICEKPFIYFENGDYFVFVPGLCTRTKGTTWSNGKVETGGSMPLSRFYIARADRDNTESIMAALKKGLNILFTPGIYKVDQTLTVQKKNSVLLGLGLATIQPTRGNIAMQVSDEGGIRIAGLIFDAGQGINSNTGTGGSPVLLQVGAKGPKKILSSNPVVLSDLFFRTGGGHTDLPCRSDIALEINAGSTIGDHFWIWRADHGGQVGWELNKADYGLVVNGDDVTVYGLFVEHFQKYDTWWKGERGRTYFYQNEKAYDVPMQKDWTGPDGNGNGWAAYRVADPVKSHEAWGIGVYSVFINTKGFVLLENAIVTPPKGNIVFHYPFTVLLSTKGGIEHIINGSGGPHTNRESTRGSLLTLPPAFNNVWKSGD